MQSDELDQLLRVLEMYSFDEGRNRIVEALGAVLELHRDAFARVLAICRERAPEAVQRMQADPVIAGILEGYGLVESTARDRVRAVVGEFETQVRQHGGQLRIHDVDASTARIQVIRPPNPAEDGRFAQFAAEIEKSVREEAPELAEVSVLCVTDLAYAEKPRAWLPLVHRFELEGGELRKIQLFDDPVLACDVGEQVFAFRDRCPDGGESLEDATRVGPVISCPRHGHRFDLSSGRCFDRPDLHLDLLPVRLDATSVQVAL